MSEEIVTLGIEVNTSGVQRGTNDLNTLTNAGSRAERGFRALAQAVSGLAMGATIKEFIQAADAMDNMSARLKLVTESQAQFASTQTRLIALANANRAGLQETVALFTKIADPIKRANGSMEDSIKIVDAFSKSLKIGGANTQEAASATLQFAQAMASGKLAGDEFRSIAEASPRFMKAIADGMGVPREALKKLAEDGKLTVDVVGNALMKVGSQLTIEFAQLPTTVGDAMVQIKNEVMVGVQELNQAGGFTQGIVAGLEDVKATMPSFKAVLVEAAKGFEGLEERTAFAEVGLTALRYTMETLLVVGANLAYMAQTAGRELGGMAAQLAALGRGDLAGVTAIGEAMKEDAEKGRQALAAFENRILTSYDKQEAMRKDATNSRADMYRHWLVQDAEFASRSIAVLQAYSGYSVEVQRAAMEALAKGMYGGKTSGGLQAPKVAEDLTKVKKAADELAQVLAKINGKELGLDSSYWKDLNTLYTAYSKGKLSLDDYAKAVGNLTKQQQFHTDAINEAERAQADYERALQSALSPLEQQARTLELEVQNYGLADSAIQSVIISRLEAARAMAVENGAWPEHLNYLDQEIELRKRIATAAGQKETLEINKKAAEDAAREWKRFSDDIERSLTDALMRSFESGESFGHAFIKNLKNALKTSALKVVIQAVVGGTGDIVGSLGNAAINAVLGTSGSNGGSGTNYLGLASNAQSAYSAYGVASNIYNYGLTDTVQGAYYGLQNFLSPAPAAGEFTVPTAAQQLQQDYYAWQALEAAPVETAAPTTTAAGAYAGLGYFAAAAAAILAIWQANKAKPINYQGMEVTGDYAGSAFSGNISSNFSRGASSWERIMPLTSDRDAVYAAMMGLDEYNPRPYEGYTYTTEDGSQQSFGGISEEESARIRAQSASLFNSGNYGALMQSSGATLPVSVDPNVLGGIDAAIEAAFNGPKSAMIALAKTFDDTALADKVNAFSTSIKVSGNTIGEIMGKITAQVSTELSQAVLPSVEAARTSGAALRASFETAIADATKAGNTAAAESLKARLDALGIVAGESWKQTFSRLMNETTAVSAMFDLLGTSMKEMFGTGDVNNALKLADSMTKAFGGIAAMNSAVNTYFENFYTEEEKFKVKQDALAAQFKVLNLEMPKTRDGFRDLVDGLKTTTDSEIATYAAVIQLSGAFAELVPTLTTSTAAIAAMAVTAEQLNNAKSALSSYLNPAQRKSVLTGNINDAALAVGVDLGPESLDNLTRASRQDFAAYVQQVANDTSEAGKRMLVALGEIAPFFEELVDLSESVETTRLQTAIDTLQAQADAILATYGDVVAAMQEINPPAKTLVDSWRDNKAELSNLQSVFDEFFGTVIPTAAQTIQGLITARDTFNGGADTAADNADNARLQTMTPAQRAAFWRKQEADLWQGLGSNPDKAGAINQIMAAYGNTRAAELEALTASQTTLNDAQKTGLESQLEAWRTTLSVIERAKSFAKDLEQFIGSLAFSDLSALGYTDQLSAASSLYGTTLSGAKGNDTEAMNNFVSNAQAYLQEAQQYYGGASLDYANIYKQVTGDASNLGLSLNTDGAGAESEIDRLTAALGKLTTTLPTDIANAFSLETADGYERIGTALNAGSAYYGDRLKEQNDLLKSQITLLQAVIDGQQAQIAQQEGNHARVVAELQSQTNRLNTIESNGALAVTA